MTQETRSNSNPWEDCDRDRLPYYTPIQAAIRWCGLAKDEARILSRTLSVYVAQGEFPEYPCLYVHCTAIRSAMETGQLACGRDGRPVGEGDHVAPERRTIQHAALKEWIRREFPADVQKPHMAWLFDDVERSIHGAITREVYETLKAEKDLLATQLHACQSATRAPALATQGDGALDTRERTTLLRIIRALDVMSKLPTRGAASSIETQLQQLGFNSPRDSAIRSAIHEARTLELDNKTL